MSLGNLSLETCANIRTSPIAQLVAQSHCFPFTGKYAAYPIAGSIHVLLCRSRHISRFMYVQYLLHMAIRIFK